MLKDEIADRRRHLPSNSLRRKLGMGPTELGKLIGVHANTVLGWERGTSFPKPANLVKLAVTFGCTIDELLAGELKLEREKKQ
jgi:transcriptional regulator with XRE-family HTH domain